MPNAASNPGTKPIVLAYSGGLDTSFLVPWVAENYSRPIITVRIKPLMANGAVKPEVTRGSNHVRFVGPRNVIRVTTNAPIT